MSKISNSDPAYKRLSIKLNKRFLNLSEDDIDWIIQNVINTKALIDRRKK